MASMFNWITQGRYLKQDRVYYHRRSTKESDCFEVKCYSNGRWYRCPNPMDSKLCKEVHDQYLNCKFTSVSIYYVPESMLGREGSWEETNSHF